MSKHTPGEWFIDRGFRDAMSGGEHTTIEDDFLTIYCGEDFDPDKSDWFEIRGPNQVANAHLIAAAPEMLEALKAIDQAIMVEGKNANLIRAAIAKAEGRK